VRALHEHREAFDARGVRIVLICFSTQERVSQWWHEVGLPEETFLMLFDRSPTRDLYARYGMRCSASSSWSPGTLLWYAGQIRQGNYRLRRLRENTSQLGGDFLLSRSGTVLLAHPSQTPIDRVQVSSLLSCIDGSEGTEACPSECLCCAVSSQGESLASAAHCADGM